LSRTRTYVGSGTAADTRANLTGQGSVTSPNTKTPTGAKKITKVIASVGTTVGSAGRCGLLVRIGGDAVGNGEQTIIVGAESFTVAESGASDPGTHVPPFVLEDADIDVSPSEALVIDAEMLDDDLGGFQAVVTLVFD